MAAAFSLICRIPSLRGSWEVILRISTTEASSGEAGNTFDAKPTRKVSREAQVVNLLHQLDMEILIGLGRRAKDERYCALHGSRLKLLCAK